MVLSEARQHMPHDIPSRTPAKGHAMLAGCITNYSLPKLQHSRLRFVSNYCQCQLALYKRALVCALLAWPETDALRPVALCSIYDQMEAAQLPCVLHQVRHCIVDFIGLRSQKCITRVKPQ